jgi:hypothetical protein
MRRKRVEIEDILDGDRDETVFTFWLHDNSVRNQNPFVF